MTEENIFSAKKMAPLLVEADELVAIFTTISKRARGDG
jgi:hypothetical protein